MTDYSQLFNEVMQNSTAKNWDKAVGEWVILDCIEDPYCSSQCICGKENIKYLFTIENFTNGKRLFPIGSSCIRKFEKENLMEEYNYTLNKYLQRFFHPFICVLLAILGCILGFSKPREQRLIGFTIAVGCIFVYYITLPFFDLLAEKEILSPYITATLPTFAFLIAIYAFYKSKDL